MENENRQRIRRLDDKLTKHISDYERHEEQECIKHRELIATQQLNTEALNNLAVSTAGLIEAWGAAEGALKVGAAFGRFIKWSAGFAVLAGALSALGVSLPHK